MTRLSLALLGILAGCANPRDLGRISARPSCAGLDRACLEDGFDAPLAVGTSVELSLELWTAPSTTPPFSLRPATEDLTVDGHDVTAVDEGVTAVLILDPSGEVLDLVHVWSQRGDALSLRAVESEVPGELADALHMSVGDTIDFRAVLERDGYDLMGSPSVQLTVDGVSVDATPGPIDGTLRIRAQEPGTSNIFVAAGELEAALSVEVVA